MIIVNAVYFKGKWKYPFKKELTYKNNFYISETNIQKVEYMKQKDKFKYNENNEIQLVRLPYEKDNMSSIIILPKEGVDINNYIINKLNYQNIT